MRRLARSSTWRDGVEDGGRGRRRGEPQGDAELAIEVAAAEGDVVAVGQAEAGVREAMPQGAQHAGLADAGLADGARSCACRALRAQSTRTCLEAGSHSSRSGSPCEGLLPEAEGGGIGVRAATTLTQGDCSESPRKGTRSTTRAVLLTPPPHLFSDRLRACAPPPSAARCHRQSGTASFGIAMAGPFKLPERTPRLSRHPTRSITLGLRRVHPSWIRGTDSADAARARRGSSHRILHAVSIRPDQRGHKDPMNHATRRARVAAASLRSLMQLCPGWANVLASDSDAPAGEPHDSGRDQTRAGSRL